jgi:hypothetical protein
MMFQDGTALCLLTSLASLLLHDMAAQNKSRAT